MRPMSGYAPDRAVTFFRFPERKSPKKGGPDGGGRPVADCSVVLGVWGLAPNSLRGLRPLRSDSRAKSVDEARYRARPQTPALLDATHGAQEQYGRLLRKHPHPRLPPPRRQGAQRPEASKRRCAARRAVGYLEQVFRGPMYFSSDKSRKEAAEAVQQRGKRLCFGYFHLTRQMFAQREFAHFAQRSYANTKVTRSPGRLPGAPAGRQKKHPREAAKTGSPHHLNHRPGIRHSPKHPPLHRHHLQRSQVIPQISRRRAIRQDQTPVSYTHLTLPTKRIV